MDTSPSDRLDPPSVPQSLPSGRIVDWLGAQGAVNLTIYSCGLCALIVTVCRALAG